MQPGFSDADKTEKVTRVPPLEESFLKSSIETFSNTSDIANSNITRTTSDVTSNSHDVTDNNNDDEMRFKDGDARIKCTNLTKNMPSETADALTMVVDDVVDEDDDVIKDSGNIVSDLKIKSDDICKRGTKTISGEKAVDDVVSDFTKQIRNIVTDVTDDVIDKIENEAKTESCEDKEKDCGAAKGPGDRIAVKVKQDLRKIQTTVDFVDEDVRDIKGDWDLNNSVCEEEEDWELDESFEDNDDSDINENNDIDLNIDHIDDNDADDIGDVDGSVGHGNNIADDIGSDDEIMDNDIKTGTYCNETVQDCSPKLGVKERKYKQSKG